MKGTVVVVLAALLAFAAAQQAAQQAPQPTQQPASPVNQWQAAHQQAHEAMQQHVQNAQNAFQQQQQQQYQSQMQQYQQQAQQQAQQYQQQAQQYQQQMQQQQQQMMQQQQQFAQRATAASQQWQQQYMPQQAQQQGFPAPYGYPGMPFFGGMQQPQQQQQQQPLTPEADPAAAQTALATGDASSRSRDSLFMGAGLSGTAIAQRAAKYLSKRGARRTKAMAYSLAKAIGRGAPGADSNHVSETSHPIDEQLNPEDVEAPQTAAPSNEEDKYSPEAGSTDNAGWQAVTAGNDASSDPYGAPVQATAPFGAGAALAGAPHDGQGGFASVQPPRRHLGPLQPSLIPSSVTGKFGATTSGVYMDPSMAGTQQEQPESGLNHGRNLAGDFDTSNLPMTGSPNDPHPMDAMGGRTGMFSPADSNNFLPVDKQQMGIGKHGPMEDPLPPPKEHVPVSAHLNENTAANLHGVDQSAAPADANPQPGLAGSQPVASADQAPAPDAAPVPANNANPLEAAKPADATLPHELPSSKPMKADDKPPQH